MKSRTRNVKRVGRLLQRMVRRLRAMWCVHQWQAIESYDESSEWKTWWHHLEPNAPALPVMAWSRFAKCRCRKCAKKSEIRFDTLFISENVVKPPDESSSATRP